MNRMRKTVRIDRFCGKKNYRKVIPRTNLLKNVQYSMKNLPKSEIYEQEFEYMSWGIAVRKVLETIKHNAPKNGNLLDLMCGPGYLLGELSKKRNDLLLEGIDFSDEFIQHAQHKYPNISFHVADVVSWQTTKEYDVIVCTAGIHHLSYEKQE